MKDYQKRLLNEFNELTTRGNKLTAFLQTETYDKLPKNKRLLLAQQESVMLHLGRILYERLQLEGIDPFADDEEDEGETFDSLMAKMCDDIRNSDMSAEEIAAKYIETDKPEYLQAVVDKINELRSKDN